MSFKLFSIWAFILIGRPQDLYPAIQPLRPALLFGVLTLLFILLKNDINKLYSIFNISDVRKYIYLFIVMIAGIPFAYHRRVAFDFVFLSYMINIMFYLVFIYEVDSMKKLKNIVMIICLSVFIFSFFAINKGSFIDGRFFYGEMFDSNDIAYVLLSILPLYFFFILNKEGILKKLFATSGIGLSTLIILYTGSRAGIIGLIAVILLILFTKLEKIRRYHKIALLITLFAIILLFAGNINIERYLTITTIGSDYNVSAESGRIQIWKRAFQLILENPLTGVGAYCFPMAIGYLREGLDIIPEWQASHNSYLQLATETGIIGFFLFGSLIFSSLKTFSNLRTIDIQVPEASQLRTLSGLLMVGFAGHLITAFFLSQGYSMFFTLSFALSATLNRIAKPYTIK